MTNKERIIYHCDDKNINDNLRFKIEVMQYQIRMSTDTQIKEQNANSKYHYHIRYNIFGHFKKKYQVKVTKTLKRPLFHNSCEKEVHKYQILNKK